MNAELPSGFCTLHPLLSILKFRLNLIFPRAIQEILRNLFFHSSQLSIIVRRFVTSSWNACLLPVANQSVNKQICCYIWQFNLKVSDMRNLTIFPHSKYNGSFILLAFCFIKLWSEFQRTGQIIWSLTRLQCISFGRIFQSR